MRYATAGKAFMPYECRSSLIGGITTSTNALTLFTLPSTSGEVFSDSEQHIEIHPPCLYSKRQTYAPNNLPLSAGRVYVDETDLSGAFPSNWRNAMLAKNIAL